MALSVVTEISVDDPVWTKKRLGLQKLADEVLLLTWKKVKGESKARPFVALTFTNDKTIRKINRQFRDKNKPTNVLSFQIWPTVDAFPDRPIPLPVGDMVFAFETVEREAKEKRISFRNHLIHLLIHGFLHLCGYDHLDDADADKMENLEISLLKSLDIKNPYFEDDKFAI